MSRVWMTIGCITSINRNVYTLSRIRCNRIDRTDPRTGALRHWFLGYSGADSQVRNLSIKRRL